MGRAGAARAKGAAGRRAMWRLASAAATVGRTIKGTRQFFKAACRAKIIDRNPFEDLKAGSNPDRERQKFITLADTQLVLDDCPDTEWRLLVALSRFGGLRCPSEHLSLTWPDVDWVQDRFWVRSPKTEHYEGKEGRWVPLFPELKPYLQDAWELAAEGAVHVITRYRDTNANLADAVSAHHPQGRSDTVAEAVPQSTRE